jgi:transcriptional antiterminator RfaH
MTHFQNHSGSAQQGHQWYVLQCVTRKELQTATFLEQYRQIMVYFPQIVQRSKQQQTAPLFPGYLFVQLDIQSGNWAAINTTPGAVRLLGCDDMALPIPDSVVAAIQAQVQHYNSQGGFIERRFEPGDHIRLCDGPFRGLEGVFLENSKPGERVRILIQLMGQLNRVDVEVDQLELVDPSPSSRPPRRTRGGGRVIKTSSAAS